MSDECEHWRAAPVFTFIRSGDGKKMVRIGCPDCKKTWDIEA